MHICIDEQHPVAEVGQKSAQIGGKRCFANATTWQRQL